MVQYLGNIMGSHKLFTPSLSFLPVDPPTNQLISRTDRYTLAFCQEATVEISPKIGYCLELMHVYPPTLLLSLIYRFVALEE